MSAFWPIAAVVGASAIAMFAGWLVQRKTRNAGLVDVIWTIGVAGSAIFYAAVGSGTQLARGTLAILAGLWGLRLATHLAVRVAREKEDGRYAFLREHWRGDQTKFLMFFEGQALLVGLFSLPFFVVAQNANDALLPWAIAAVLVWIVSVGGEALADRQLAAFRADPSNRGKTCRAGLWRYSRHPNYFFEWTHWFAYVLLAVGAPLFWLSFAGPVVMLISLYWVTGIPFTEAQALRSRGDEYRAYQRTTSPFIPWFPRRDDGAETRSTT